MTDSIKSSRLLEVGSKLDSAGPLSRNPGPPTIQECASEAAGAARLDPQANLNESEQYRADIIRRYEAPFPFEERHGRLNA
jgi:hypothetical protein